MREEILYNLRAGTNAKIEDALQRGLGRSIPHHILALEIALIEPPNGMAELTRKGHPTNFTLFVTSY